MATQTTPETTRKVRAEINDATHKALQIRQNRIQESTGTRPQITDVISAALNEWAALQNQTV
jgi:hypothetical protein